MVSDAFQREDIYRSKRGEKPAAFSSDFGASQRISGT
jgi:hypothetical protein